MELRELMEPREVVDEVVDAHGSMCGGTNCGVDGEG